MTVVRMDGEFGLGDSILFSPVTNYVRDNTTNGTATGDALL